MTEKELMMIKRDLQKRAKKMGLGKKRSGAYVFGTLRRIRGNPRKCEEAYDDNWDDREMILVSEKTLKPACIGQKVKSFRGEYAILEGGRAPHKEGSTGKVWVKEAGSSSQREYYPSVYGLAWIPSVNVFPIDKVTQEPRFKLRGNPIQSKIERFRRIFNDRQSAVIQGTRVDTYAASAVISVYDKLDSGRKIKFAKMSVPKMISVAIGIIGDQWSSDFDRRQLWHTRRSRQGSPSPSTSRT